MMSFNGNICVIGDPIAHSLSPIIQNAMLKSLGLPKLYTALQVSSDNLSSWITKARSAYSGFNITMPHKSAIVPMMDFLSQDSKLNRAVNAVSVRDGLLYGFNTDGQGFALALSDCGVDVQGLDAVLLGAGGAARAIAIKLALCGAERVSLCCRNPKKVQGLLPDFSSIDIVPWNDIFNRVSTCDLLVNCTPLGMEGVEGQFSTLDFLSGLHKKTFVCDVIYNPLETLFLQTARKYGYKTMNGLPMLINQAILSLELFLGQQLPIKDLQRVAENALLSEKGLNIKTSAES